MKKIRENTFLIPVGENFLIYSPLNGISALINRKAAVELKKQLRWDAEGQVNQVRELFELANLIVSAPLDKVNIKTNGFNPEFLGIIPTRVCNGACNYCDFGAGQASADKMSCHTAVRIVDWYTNLIEKQKRKAIEIHFFGGEPMMAFDVLEVIVHRTRLLASEKKLMPCFDISTNGQYNEKKARFLGNYFNQVVLSLDGMEEIQNFHRPLKDGKGSFKNASQTAKIISASQAELYLRTCISSVNVSLMEEIVRFFSESFSPSVINFEILCPTAITRSKNLVPPDPYEFAVNFIKARRIGYQLGIRIIYASDIGERLTTSSCPVGKDTVIFSPDGRISSCYLMPEKWHEAGIELGIGRMDSTGKILINDNQIKKLRRMVLDKPRCLNCFCRWSCAGGCHVGNTFPGCTKEYDDFCIQTRLISAFTLLFDLGLPEKSDELLQHRENMQKLALNFSDLLDDLP